MSLFRRLSYPTVAPIKKIGWLVALQIAASILLGFAVTEHPMLVMAALVMVSTAIVAVIWPESLTLLVFFLLYSNTAAIAVQFHGIPFIVGASVPLLLLMPLANYVILHRQQLIITPLVLVILLFHIVQLIGAVFSQNVSTAANNLTRHLVEGIILYLLVINTVRSVETLRRVIWVLLLAGGLIGALGFYQVITGTYDNNYGGFAQVSNAAFDTGGTTVQGEVQQPRLAGSVGEQNRQAQVMLMLIPIGLFLLGGEYSKVRRLIAVSLTAFTALGVATTFSRGAALAFGLMLLVMVIMRYITIYQLAAVLLGLTILFTVALPQYGVRILRLEGLVGLFAEKGTVSQEARPDGSLKKRSTEMWAAALVFADHPIIGVGPDMFRYYYLEYAPLIGDNVQYGQDRQAHNLYLSIAADTGILGISCFFFVIGKTLYDLAQTRKKWRQSHPQLASVATGFILAIITYMGTGIGLHFAFVRFFWLIMALAHVASILVPLPTTITEGKEELSKTRQLWPNTVSFAKQ